MACAYCEMNDGIVLNKPHLSHSNTNFHKILFCHALHLMMMMMMMMMMLLILTTASLKSYFTNRSIMF